MFNLKGKVAVITGASSGLGKQMARGFANIMKKNNYGRIINIASIYGLVGNTALDTVAYHSSKGWGSKFHKSSSCRTCKV